MKARFVFNMVNQSTIMSDWEPGTRLEVEESIRNKVLPVLGDITYFNVVVNGVMRVIVLHAVTDFYVEEQSDGGGE